MTQKSLPNVEEDNEYLRIRNDLAVFEELQVSDKDSELSSG